MRVQRTATRTATRSLPFSDEERAQLRRLTNQGFALRNTGYAVDAAEAIVTWFEEVLPDVLARRASWNGTIDP